MPDTPREPPPAGLDPQAWIDPRLDAADRAGLTGTTGASVYATPFDRREQLTIPPDGRPLEDQPGWRQDFPIDWPQDHYVERRDFVKFLVLTSLAFTVGQYWIGAQNWWRKRRGQPEIREVATVAGLPIGGVATFAYPGPEDACVLIRTGAGTFVAYSQKCTHLSCAVQPVVADNVMRCPCHDGLFDLASGRPLAGPPRRPLPIIRLSVRGDRIYATGVEPRTV